MKTLIDFFLNRSLVVNLISVMIIATGLISVYILQKEVFPTIDFGYVSITTDYPGASAEDVEKLVTISLERQLKEVEGIEEVNSISAENRSMIYVKVDPGYKTEKVFNDVKTAAEQVSDFPEKVERPLVKVLDNNQPILRVALIGLEEEELRDISKRLRDRLELNPKVSNISLTGYREEEINVALDPKKLDQYELTVSEVVAAVGSRNINLSAGTIETGSSDILLRTVSEYANSADIGSVVIRSNASGRKVTVADVATVRRQLKKGNVLNRAQGKRAVYLNIKKKEAADIIKTTKVIKEDVESFFKTENHSGLEYLYVDDLSFYVNRRLTILGQNGIQGMALVFICLILFLNFRTAIMTSLGAPLAFMFAFAMMDAMGLSINLISMFGLILVLGMLVDDSIIVAEQFYQNIEKGMDPKSAARKAALQTIKPVFATILTTMVAFGSLFFMGGIMGKYLWPVPAVVIICLLASMFECFFILPNHLSEFVKKKGKAEKTNWYAPLYWLYEKTLKFSVRFNYLVVALFIGSLVLSGFIFNKMPKELFPGDDVRILFMHVKGKVGTPLEQTNQAMKKMDEIILNTIQKNELESLRTLVGAQISEQSTKPGSHYGSAIVYLTQSFERERTSGAIIELVLEQAKKAVPDFNVTFKKVNHGPPKGKAVEIELQGSDLEEIKSVAREVQTKLEGVDGVISPEVDFEAGKKQILVSINDEEARRLGLTTTQVAMELRRAYASDAVTTIRHSDEDVDVVVQLNESARSDIGNVDNLFILNSQLRRIRLSKVAKISEIPGAFVIRRLNGRRTISVEAEINREVATPLSVGAAIKPSLEKLLKDHPDMNYTIGGENKDTQESLMRLAKAGVIAMFCIFIILVTMFSSLGQPMVIMSAIPLGLVGVVMTFYLMGLSLSFMAFMGVVGLVGVVVNDSIVLVNFINEELDNGLELREAVFEGARSRFRAVILTTFTTVAGLLPIAHARAGDPFLKPMAISFAYGLMFSSMVTLIFVPCSYIIYYQVKMFFRRLLGKDQSPSTPAEPPVDGVPNI